MAALVSLQVTPVMHPWMLIGHCLSQVIRELQGGNLLLNFSNVDLLYLYTDLKVAGRAALFFSFTCLCVKTHLFILGS